MWQAKLRRASGEGERAARVDVREVVDESYQCLPDFGNVKTGCIAKQGFSSSMGTFTGSGGFPT